MKMFPKGNQPYSPSTKVITQIHKTAIDATAPSTTSSGFDVSGLNEVLLSVYSFSPDTTSPTYPGFSGTIRVWRFKESAMGTSNPSGQWVVAGDYIVSFTGRNGPMEHVIPTMQSEKMHLQLISTASTPPTWDVILAVYQLTPRLNEDDQISSDYAHTPQWSHQAEGVLTFAFGAVPAVTVWHTQTISIRSFRKLALQIDIDPGNDGAGPPAGDGTINVYIEGRVHSDAEWQELNTWVWTIANPLVFTGPDGTVISNTLVDNTERLATFSEIRIGTMYPAGNTGHAGDVHWRLVY